MGLEPLGGCVADLVGLALKEPRSGVHQRDLLPRKRLDDLRSQLDAEGAAPDDDDGLGILDLGERALQLLLPLHQAHGLRLCVHASAVGAAGGDDEVIKR